MATEKTRPAGPRPPGSPPRAMRGPLTWLAALGSVAVLAVIAVVGVLLARGGGAAPVSQGDNPAAIKSAIAANPGVDPGTSMGDRVAPGFQLTNQSGQPVALGQFHGKVVLLAFVDSTCTTICPLTTTAMLEAKQMLGPAAARVALVGVNANPEATTVADVRAYTHAHGLVNQWQFLTGSKSQLAAVWRDYNVYAAVTRTGIDHEPVIYVIDSSGHEREVYVTQMAYGAVHAQAAVIAGKVAALLPGHPKPNTGPTAQPPAVTPGQTVSLPSASGGAPVVLGPGHPHLVVFFDTWLNETSNLAARLDALNAYAALAKARGWPSPVAVDEAPVEASPGALGTFLHSLPKPLAFPVVVDTTGGVADGYQVADQPFFVLTSPAGKTLFTNDGWFSPAQLDAAVAKAQAKLPTSSHTSS